VGKRTPLVTSVRKLRERLINHYRLENYFPNLALRRFEPIITDELRGDDPSPLNASSSIKPELATKETGEPSYTYTREQTEAISPPISDAHSLAENADTSPSIDAYIDKDIGHSEIRNSKYPGVSLSSFEQWVANPQLAKKMDERDKDTRTTLAAIFEDDSDATSDENDLTMRVSTANSVDDGEFTSSSASFFQDHFPSMIRFLIENIGKEHTIKVNNVKHFALSKSLMPEGFVAALNQWSDSESQTLLLEEDGDTYYVDYDCLMKAQAKFCSSPDA
jgi:hypothetical protein